MTNAREWSITQVNTHHYPCWSAMQDLFDSDKANPSHPQHRARQLVILCDGTSNTVQGQGGTNVLKLLSALPADDAMQKVFYDTGVGSPAYAPGTTWLDQLKLTWQRVQGLAFGQGVFDNISQAYEFLMREYQPGDQILYLASRVARSRRALSWAWSMRLGSCQRTARI
ncbi:MAG: DUF2235 domain-containing protein [Brachymonas sp.]|nr:DUF2235 domain-containing protein [Brachymonas sp.]